jgi:hypothetical protein
VALTFRGTPPTTLNCGPLAALARKPDKSWGLLMSGDARTAYLFQCDGEDLFAVTPEKSGANIPRSSCTQGWLLRQEFRLSAQDPVPAPIRSETIIRGMNAMGYYIWRVGR